MTQHIQHTQQFATRVICNTCNLQHLKFATRENCNTWNLQHMQFGEYPHHHYGSEEGPTLWVGLSPTWGVRGDECPIIPPVHWKGVALPRQRSSRTLKTLSNCKGFYSVFSAVERYLYLRDFFYYYDRFFNFIFERFLKSIFQRFLKQRFKRLMQCKVQCARCNV